VKSERRVGERLYQALTHLYPREFRDDHDVDLLEVFRFARDARLERVGRLGFGFWGFMLRDVVTSAWREWRRPLRPDGTRRVRRETGGEMMRGWIDDIVYAARRLIRSPGFTATALTILVLGIGVNSTAYGVINALLLQPPPFEQPDRLVNVLQDGDGGEPSSTSYPAYLDMTRTPDVFSGVSAYYADQAFMQQGDGLVSLLVEYATASYMDVIGLRPSRGRWFDEAADDPNGPPHAVLTHAMWRDRMAEDPDVIGQTLRLGGGAVTVIGVGPPEFNGGQGPGAVDLWLSISAMAPTGGRAGSLTRRQDHPFTIRARLADGVPIEDAQQSMNRLAADLATTYPTLNEGRDITVLSVLENRISPSEDAELIPAAIFSMLVVLLVLVIGTLNLANLLLVRSTTRAREIAVRLALGAGRARVIRVVLAEAMVLSALGGAGGLALTFLAVDRMRNARFDFSLPILVDLKLDASVLLFTLSVSVLTGLVFGLVPALRATRRDVNASLRDEPATGLGARRRMGLTGALVASQVAVSLLLLAIAGLFIENLMRARGADPGFAWENTAFVQLNATPLDLDGEATLLLLDQVEERLTALPGVGRVTRSLMLPGTQFGSTTMLLGAGAGGVDRPTEVAWNYVSTNFFGVMNVPLLHGRTFQEDESQGVAIVSEAFGRTYWGRSDVVGESYRPEAAPDSPVEIIGVVGSTTIRSLSEAPTPSVYFPLTFASARMNILFEMEGPSSIALASARAAVVELDPRIMILDAATMGEHLGDTLQRERMLGGVMAGLGALALMLAMLGIYGVVSFAVSRRRHEVGIRIALGAGSESVVRLFVRDVAMVVLAGSAVGLALSLAAGRAIGQLFTGSGGSPASTVAVAALLLVTSLIATVVPAMRATRTDPTDALRRE
jgi:predicted permease